MRETCSLMDFLEEIPEDIQTDIESLGPCRIENPLNLPAGCFVTDEMRITLRVSENFLKETLGQGGRLPTAELAGPRPYIYFDPAKTRAVIVTCGGLCPGINDVIRSIVLTLYHSYGVRHIYGIRYGLQGFIPAYGHDIVELTPEVVASIHELGGTFLGTSRGTNPSIRSWTPWKD